MMSTRTNVIRGVGFVGQMECKAVVGRVNSSGVAVRSLRHVFLTDRSLKELRDAGKQWAPSDRCGDLQGFSRVETGLRLPLVLANHCKDDRWLGKREFLEEASMHASDG